MVVELLRKKGYRGYIHLRLMPGTPKDLVFHAAVLADRVGINVEAPKEFFKEIAPGKGDWVNDIIKRIEWLVKLKKFLRKKKAPGYLSSGVDTQIMLGVYNETDLEVLETAWYLLKLGVDRIYVSGFKPYPNTPLGKQRPASKWRVLRVTQAIELMRVYGYSFDEIKELVNDDGMLPNIDPKVAYAEKHKWLFPIDINNDPYELLIKVPGIGPRSARKIIIVRKQRRIDRTLLSKIIGYKNMIKALKYIVI